ncbi:hypothetical protein N2152v2_011088 [Parachlorella kessleri]
MLHRFQQEALHLQPGTSIVCHLGPSSDQFPALFVKNGLVSLRNYRATLLRLFSPLFFMFLLWLVNIAVKADNPNEPVFSNNPYPDVDVVAPIPECSTDTFVRLPCWDFFYTPNNSSTVQGIVDSIRANNPGRPISPDAVQGFADIDSVNAWLLDNPERTTAIVHFQEQSSGALDFSLQTNTTLKFFKGNFQDPVFFSMVPLQAAVEREVARYYWAQVGRPADAFNWTMSLSIFAHPTTTELNVVGSAMGPFVFATNMFTFVLLLAAIVTEKELGLRQALRTMGMMDSAFWLSWLVFEVLAAVVFTLVLIGFGAAFQFQFFLINSFGLVFVLFFLFQIAMVSVSFMLSTFLQKGSSAVSLGFVIFILGWIIQSVVAFGYPFTPDYIGRVPVLTVIFALMPWTMLAKGSIDLGKASLDDSSDGLRWSQRTSYCKDISDPTQQDAAYVQGAYQDFDCVFPLNTCYWVLLLEFILYFFIAVYLDNVLPDKNGVRRKVWYPFTRAYWTGYGGRLRGRNSVQTARGVRHIKPPIPRPVEAEETVDEDVAAEEQRMKDLLEHRTGSGDSLALQADDSNAVEVYGLQRVFRAGRFTRLANKLRAGKLVRYFPDWGNKRHGDFWAVKGSWFAIEKGRLFCLLGPNGAGKTTTINCLTGVLPPSGGDALVYGESLSTQGGLDRIRAMMGVCPQFDVLWGELSGAEHLHLYGRIKGIPRKDLKFQAGDLLDQVKLTGAAKVRTAAYSGGMRRRLSVAIALLGDPLIVYLDEPTTGMDPISRRHVWDIIERAKPGRAIVLTTHSMEEADILGDNVAIMARGRVCAFGSTLRLKQRFGSGYQLSVSVLPATAAGQVQESAEVLAQRARDVKAFFKAELDVVAVDETRAYMLFLVPKDREARLRLFLQRLEACRRQLGVTDVQISLTSLEEVFLNIARKVAELEAAAAEGRSSVQVQLDDGQALEVPLGDEYATCPTTGMRYHIKWGQDEAGNLQVLRWTPLNGGEDLVLPGGSEDDSGHAAQAARTHDAALEMARRK